jgi:probable addiction module antidote protein
VVKKGSPIKKPSSREYNIPFKKKAVFLRGQMFATYVTMVIEDGDAAELAHALGIAAKARGMSEIAQASGITREALYKALKPNAKPRFDTINRVCAALGVRLVAQPVH